MRKEAFDWKEGLCDLLSVEELGPVAGPAACHTVVNQVGNVIQKGKEGAQSGKNKNILYNAKIAFQTLANQLRGFGCTDPNYTDPDKLMSFFGRTGQMGYEGWDLSKLTKLVGALGEFLTMGASIKAEYPDFVNSAVKYVFQHYERNGYNAELTIQNLQKLQEKAADPKFNFYVINLLKGNYQAAIFYDMLLNFKMGDINPAIKKDMAEVTNLAIKMLGKQTPWIINTNNYRKILADRNMQIFDSRDNLWTATLDARKMSLKWETYLLKNVVDPNVKAIFSNPAVKTVTAAIMSIMDLPDAISGVGGGFGEGAPTGGGR